MERGWRWGGPGPALAARQDGVPVGSSCMGRGAAAQVPVVVIAQSSSTEQSGAPATWASSG